MSKALYFILLLCITLSVAFAKRHPRSQHPLCQKFHGTHPSNSSLFFPYLCMSNDEYSALGTRGYAFKMNAKPSTLDPVLLIPGLGGSGLDGKLTNAKEPHWYCSSTTKDWFRLWISLTSMVGGYIDCWYNNMMVHYDAATNTYSNSQGVQVRPIDWGGLKGIDYLDTDYSGNGLSFTSYFAPIIKEFEAVGYKPGLNLRGAPFDWRLPVTADNMIDKAKALVEQMYEDNGQRPVHLLAHSMGNIHISIMLNNTSQAWKDKYVASFISVAAPWSGSPKALRALISGDNFGLGAGDWFSLVDPLRVAEIVRQAGGVVLLTPEPDFWDNEVLVTTPTKTYTANDIQTLFNDLGSPVTSQILQTIDGTLSSIQAPGVVTHCLYGVDYATEIKFNYKNGFNKNPEITYSQEGDGTVPDVSLRKCKDFAVRQTQKVEIQEFDLADHMTVLNDDDVIAYILNTVTH